MHAATNYKFMDNLLCSNTLSAWPPHKFSTLTRTHLHCCTICYPIQEASSPLCHKGEFNPSWMVNAVLLLDLFYVTLICTLGQEPKNFIELFLRNNSFWWLKIYLFRLIHIFQCICPLCIKTFLCYSYRVHNAILQYTHTSAA